MKICISRRHDIAEGSEEATVSPHCSGVLWIIWEEEQRSDTVPGHRDGREHAQIHCAPLLLRLSAEEVQVQELQSLQVGGGFLPRLSSLHAGVRLSMVGSPRTAVPRNKRARMGRGQKVRHWSTDRLYISVHPMCLSTRIIYIIKR